MAKAPTMAQMMCKHEHCKVLGFVLGQGTQKKCEDCGVVLVDRYRGPQPANIPGTKVRKSKKERRREQFLARANAAAHLPHDAGEQNEQ